ARYFGPYESRSVKDTIRLIKKLFPIRWCKESPLKFRQQPCLQYHLKHCMGPCIGGIKKEEYQNYVKAMIKVLEGDLAAAIRYLQEEMEIASKEQRYEQAARIRDRIRNLSRVLQKKPDWAPKIKEKAGDTSAWELKNALGLRKSPSHIEAFDISNIQRENLVASMVTFRNGEPSKSEYRKFKIRGFTLPNDVAAINQVVGRRYTGSLKDKMEIPDLVLIDGGIAQVRSAKKAMDKAGIKVPVIGLAKQNEEIFFPDKNIPLKLNKDSVALLLLMRIRDEAHRFAIAFHRASRRLVK
ncbi:MAG: UvrB/UvrC motif-containing protein, partial [Candidatus Margulisiibacteriota bacterium]